MSVSVTFDGDGLVRLRLRVREMRERASDLTPVMKTSAVLLDGVIQGAFASSSSPNGAAWAPLSPVTVARRRKGSSKPLVDTRQLSTATTVTAEKKGVVFGTSGAPATYAATHQFGRPTNRFYNTPKGRPAPIPARPFLPIDRDGDADFSSGPARTWKERTLERVSAYVLNGKL